MFTQDPKISVCGTLKAPSDKETLVYPCFNIVSPYVVFTNLHVINIHVSFIAFDRL
jgi:hypothetical protein